MKHSVFKSKNLIWLATAFCLLSTLSCNKDNSSYKGGGSSVESEEVSTGSCTVSGTTYEGATLYYIKSYDEYYIDCFFEGNGAFNFYWNRNTDSISMIDCFTGLYKNCFPIYFLSQSMYDSEMGSNAKPSYYDPQNNTFTFNVMYETSNDGITVYREPMTITYVPAKAN